MCTAVAFVCNGIYGLKNIDVKNDDLVLIHDAVRPLVSQSIISSNIATCKHYGYAITGIRCREAILESEDGFYSTTSISRDKLIRTQTPQTFRLEDIIKKLEAGDSTLEESFTCYEAGMKLVKSLSGQIDNVEKQIQILSEGDENE